MKKYFLEKLGEDEVNGLCKRPEIDFEKVFGVVRGVLNDVNERGDKALAEYTEKFDGVLVENFKVSEQEICDAASRVPQDLKDAFEVAANNIRKFQGRDGSDPCEIETSKGVKCFSKMRAIEKVGLYIPGGSAPLPSTVLMLAIPASLAGCKEIVMCTPPDKNGNVPDIILYAAKLAGVSSIFKVGGAQAIAAMAYGTESVPRVSKIFGPGNQYVTAAKMLLSIDPKGAAMDMPAGPSEVLVIADDRARPDFVAADLLSQAEHGPDSQVVLVCFDEQKADEVLDEIELQCRNLPRGDILQKSLSQSFALVVSGDDYDEKILKAIEFSNKYAPEHLILNVENAKSYIDKVVNAGSVFLGKWSCESAGDYASGTNHVLPTYGYAQMYGGLGVNDFMKKITFQELSEEGVKNLGPVVEKMAEVEGLYFHKNAMSCRINVLKR